jgi:hypothetical protein
VQSSVRWWVPLKAVSLLVRGMEPGMGLWRSGPLQPGPLQRAPSWLTKEPWMGLLLLVPGMGLLLLVPGMGLLLLVPGMELLLLVPGMERPEGPGPKGTSS